MVLAAWCARLPEIRQAAHALAAGWVASIIVYVFFAKSGMSWGLAIIDGALAFYFFTQSRNRWFPLPLFFVHVLLLLYHLVISVCGALHWSWIAFVVNRAFELTLLYVICCAAFRIRALDLKAGRSSKQGRSGKAALPSVYDSETV